LEFIQNFADEHGNKLAPASIGLPAEIPQDVRNVVTFKALGEHRTELTVTEYGYPPTRSWSYPRPALSRSSTSWPPASNNPAMHMAVLSFGCG
jgi:hypothetical protein